MQSERARVGPESRSSGRYRVCPPRFGSPRFLARMKPSFPASVRALLVACALLAACSSSDDDDESFVLRVSQLAAETGATPVVVGPWMVYFAREAFNGPTGTDLNGDGLKDDQVAIAVNLLAPSETNIGVAARSAVISGSHVYLVVLEAEDGNDWNGIAGDDRVLLHWSAEAGMPTFVDTLWPDEDPVAVGARVFYASA